MGVMPVNRLLISMSLPMMASMFIQACYNVVDSIFVAKIGEEALTAVSLAFPVQQLMVSLGIGTAVGVNALLSRSLGQKRFQRVNKTACTGVILGCLNFLLSLIFGLFFTRQYFMWQTNVPDIIRYGHDYLFICTVFSFGIFGQLVFARLLQSTGLTFYSMITQGAGAIINLILDPIMIFGLFGFPRMEVAGAAIATVIGQIAACCLSIHFNRTKNREIQMSRRYFKLEKPIVWKIYSVGLPSIVMTSIGSVMAFGLNAILLSFTPTAAAVLGIYFKLQSFIFMPVFGLNNGLVPILAYNYGARKYERIVQSMRLTVIYATGIMLAGLALFWLLTPQLLLLFEASPEMIEIGVPALRIVSLSFLAAGFCISIITLCQAMGQGFLSLIVSVVRQLVVLLPSAWLFSKIGGLGAIWWSFPFAEIFSAVLCFIILRHIYTKQIKPLAQALPVNEDGTTPLGQS